VKVVSAGATGVGKMNWRERIYRVVLDYEET
jgi:hypothetical protein